MSELIYAQASPHSIGKKSLLLADKVDQKNVDKFKSEKRLVNKAVKQLQEYGFEVLQSSPTSISIRGKKELYEKVFGNKIEKRSEKVLGSLGQKQSIDMYSVSSSDRPLLLNTDNSELRDTLEGIAFAVKPVYFGSAYAPTKGYWHLRVPGDVSLGLNADLVHRQGNTGKGIRVTMVDTGWQSHPYFTQRGYNILPTVLGPGATNAAVDSDGHGTAESANIFAVAPDVTFNMVKMGSDPVGDFNKAALAVPKPHIISNSWGYDIQNGPLDAYLNTLAAAVSSAVNNGIIVVFSAGNGHWGFPGQHPAVISAGGVFMDQLGKLKASNYASGFQSNIFANRKVPDVCGLVGMLPSAAYIMLPLPDGCSIDSSLAGGIHPNKDETTASDGWAAISGTSAAAPQIAGVCALLKKKNSALTPAQIKSILKSSAIDVTIGTCHPATGGNAAGPGVDLATGSGLVNAYKAFTLA